MKQEILKALSVRLQKQPLDQAELLAVATQLQLLIDGEIRKQNLRDCLLEEYPSRPDWGRDSYGKDHWK